MKIRFRFKKEFFWERAYNSNNNKFAQKKIKFDSTEIKKKLRFFIKKWITVYIKKGSFLQDEEYIFADFILETIEKAEFLHKEMGKIFGSGNAEMMEYVAKNSS